MYLVFLDTETTGLNPENHRIIEIAYKVVDSKAKRVVFSYETIISQPLEVWAAADPDSLKISGFIWEDLLHGKIEKVVADEIALDLNHLGLGTSEGVFICQNPSFDRAFFLQIINPDMQESYGWPYHWLDLASMYWALCHKEGVTSIVKEKDLSKDAIAAHFGIPAEVQPHRAMNGVKHLMACYEALFGKFVEVSPSVAVTSGA